MTEISQIYDALHSLGITRNCKGCRQAARAVQLALEDEERLEHIMKEIYWVIADEIGCERADVERNIRTIASRAWQANRERLIRMARYPVPFVPSASEFLAIVVAHIKRTADAAAHR
ncbi:MAG TPA: sporulation initiation factor Spo0A C-terminal domain-containing protein [Candidatus Ruthenibacterium merdigallinarum]|nr:sporulation initiation factor Spo0A C-terminal domain-containing protein [Candidatus Ruthenibacterium merdigallinarum]